jgi:hypothetical protein
MLTLSIEEREDGGDPTLKLSLMRSISVSRLGSLSSGQNLLFSPVRPEYSSCEEDNFRFMEGRSLGNARRSSRRGEGGRMDVEEDKREEEEPIGRCV